MPSEILFVIIAMLMSISLLGAGWAFQHVLNDSSTGKVGPDFRPSLTPFELDGVWVLSIVLASSLYSVKLISMLLGG